MQDLYSAYIYIQFQNLYFILYSFTVCPFPSLLKWTYHWSSSSAIVVLSTFKDLCKKGMCCYCVRTHTYEFHGHWIFTSWSKMAEMPHNFRIIETLFASCCVRTRGFFYFMLCTSIASLTFRCIDHYGVGS